MSRLRFFLIPLLLIFIGGTMNAQQGGGSGRGAASSGQPAASGGAPGGLPIASAELSQQSHTISLGGRIEPRSRVIHQIDSAGYVEAILVDVGEMVEAGQALLSVTRKDDVLNLYKPVVIIARISGRVSDVLVQLEDEVKAGEEAVVIIGTEGYILQAYVSDKDAFRIDPGQGIVARTAGGKTIRGTLVSRSPEPDYTTGLFQLSFAFPNNQQIYTGEFVLIDLPIDRTRGVFIRRDQVIRRYGKHFIWIVTEDRTLEAREVELGTAFGELVLIEEGLEAGETYLSRLTGREKRGRSWSSRIADMLEAIFRRKTGFILLAVILCGAGVLLMSRLPIQLYPQTQRPRVRAWITHTGISGVDFADKYAEDIEARLIGVDGVEILEVEYENDRSSFMLTFDWQTESEEAKSDIESVMNAISDLLPTDIADNTFVGFFSGENAGYLMMGITSPSTSPEELFRILDTSVKPMMSSVSEAESIDFYSVEDLTVQVSLRQTDLLANGLTIRDVETAMQTGYRPESVGTLESGEVSYSVRFRRDIESVYDLGSLVIVQRGNTFIRLQDVADISITYENPRRTFIMDGTRGIRITASPVDGGNVRKMSSDVQAILERAIAENILPDDTELQMYLDPADYIDRSINNVAQAALLGAIFAMLIVLFSLGVLRNTLLIGISLPVTLILTFIPLYFFNVSLNLISLGGIALAVGMVIDSSIVVMENIHRFRLSESPIADNRQLKNLIVRSVDQVRAPVIASTLTSVLVFFPISFTAPLTNAILGDQAKAVIFALLISMVVALTLIPVLASLFYRGRRGVPARVGSELMGLQRLSNPVMNFFKELYKKMLTALLRRRWATLLFIGLSFGLLAFTVYRVLPLVPREIISPPSSDRIVMYFRSPRIYDIDQIIEEIVPALDARIRKGVGDQVDRTYADVFGRFNRYFINLKSSDNTEEVQAELQKIFVSDNTWYYNVMMWDPAQLPLPRTMDLQVSVQGDDPAQAVTILEKMRDIVNETELYGWTFTDPGTNFSDELTMTARTEVIEGFPEYTERSLLTLVRKILGGTVSVEFEADYETVSASAFYPDEQVASRQKLENFLIPFKQATVPLKHFFDFRETTGVSGIASENGERIFRLYARMPSGTAAAEREKREEAIREAFNEQLELPPGYAVLFDNPQEEMDQAIRSLFIALAASVVLIYLLLAFQFNSIRIPLVILVTIPLGFIGVITSLYVFKSTLSLNSMLGTILLAGIVVNNAIIMIDFYLKTLPKFENRLEALVETAGIRFTPVVITTLTTIFGMLPIAIGLGEGSNIIQPLGIAVSGGLLISALFTLFMVPSILSMMGLKPAEEREQ